MMIILERRRNAESMCRLLFYFWNTCCFLGLPFSEKAKRKNKAINAGIQNDIFYLWFVDSWNTSPIKQNSVALGKTKRYYLQKANPIKHPFLPGRDKKVKIKTRQLLWYVNDTWRFHSNPMLTNSSAYHQLRYFSLRLVPYDDTIFW